MKNIDHDQIFSEMKKCFRNVGLCVIYEHLPCGKEPYSFRSLIPGLPDADVRAWYDIENGYATLRIELAETKGIENKEELTCLINDLNCDYDLYHYTICPDCGALEMRSGIAVSDVFPTEKFSRLLKEVTAELSRSVPEILNMEGEGQ